MRSPLAATEMDAQRIARKRLQSRVRAPLMAVHVVAFALLHYVLLSLWLPGGLF